MEIVSNAVAVIVCRGEGTATEMLLMRRAKGFLHGEWCQVTGKIERGETGWQAAVREVCEETGATEFDLYTAGYCDSFYNPEADRIEVLPMFVALVAADQVVEMNQENTECRWVRIGEAEGILPFVGHRIALREVIADFVNRSPPSWRAIKHHMRKDS